MAHQERIIRNLELKTEKNRNSEEMELGRRGDEMELTEIKKVRWVFSDEHGRSDGGPAIGLE